MVKNHKKNLKIIFVPKVTNTFDFSSQKSKKKLVVFFSDFSHGITHRQRDSKAKNCIFASPNLPITYYLSPVTCHLSPVTCHLSPVTCHLSPVPCHLSPVICHLSPVTCHLSPVTCHLSPALPCLLSNLCWLRLCLCRSL